MIDKLVDGVWLDGGDLPDYVHNKVKSRLWFTLCLPRHIVTSGIIVYAVLLILFKGSFTPFTGTVAVALGIAIVAFAVLAFRHRGAWTKLMSGDYKWRVDTPEKDRSGRGSIVVLNGERYRWCDGTNLTNQFLFLKVGEQRYSFGVKEEMFDEMLRG